MIGMVDLWRWFKDASTGGRPKRHNTKHPDRACIKRRNTIAKASRKRNRR